MSINTTNYKQHQQRDELAATPTTQQTNNNTINTMEQHAKATQRSNMKK